MRSRYRILFLCIATIVAASTCFGATYTVNKTADTNDGVCDSDCSLREAITRANASPDDDVVNFDASVFASPQTLILSGGELVFANGTRTTVTGPGSTLLTVDGNDASRIFFISEGAVISISGMKLTKGNGIGGFDNSNQGGAVRVFSGNLTLTDLVIAQNRATSAQGGGIYVSNGSVLSMSNSELLNNVGDIGAGALDSRDSRVDLLHVSMSAHNYGIFVGGIRSDNVFNAQSCTFRNNASTGNGAAILNFGQKVTVRDSVIRDNTTLSGGAISVANGSLTVERSTFINNVSTWGGGGAIRSFGKLSVSDSVFRNNTAGDGDGGGAIFHRASLTTVMIDRSTFEGNSTTGYGGAILNAGGGLNEAPAMVITNSLISGNSSSNSGGGVHIQGGPFESARTEFTNVTITQNSTAASGGGVGLQNQHTVALFTNTTVAANRASNSTGGILNPGSTYLRNTLIANNESGSGQPKDVSGAFYSYGYNLIRDSVGATFVGDPTGNIFAVDPLLAPLSDNGGPTRTLALRSGSPAIDKGSFVNPSLFIDQRGFPRPVDFESVPNAGGGTGSDIGAFERQANDVVVQRREFDIDGDGKSDFGIFRPSNGTWYVLKSQTGTSENFAFGTNGDVLVDVDFDGDLKADYAVWRPSTGEWFWRNSSNGTFGGAQWGTNGDRPVPADYDGDGKTDLAVWRASDGLNYIVRSTGGFLGVQWGTVGDIPSHADFNGDGKTDFAVFRPSNGTWYTLINGTSTTEQLQFGQNGDIPVRIDVDGDQKGDIAVWRPATGEWFYRRSTNGTFGGLQWGANGDRPVPGDYDGDGRTDFAAWRSTDGIHYIVRNSGGFIGVQWGGAGDIPVLGSLLP